MLATLNSLYQMRVKKVAKFKPKIHFEKKIGNFIYKTVSDTAELKEALELRYQVFHRELMEKSKPTGIDVDDFDADCDHLIIIDTRKGNKIIGTYRLNCSSFTDKFYTGQEFILTKILALPGVKLELGRACIHKDYRRGIIISLLWKGIADYMMASGAEYLFGCGTVKTANPREAALLYRYFMETGRISPKFFCPPTLKYTMPNLMFWLSAPQAPLTDAEKAEAEALIPPLMRSYLNVGCYIGGEPAWDEEYKCIDFLILVQKSDLSKHVWRRYSGADSGAE